MTLLIYLLITTCCWVRVTVATKTLYVGGLFDLGNVESWKVIPAAKMAVEEINSRNTIPGYRLQLLINDTRNGNLKVASGVNSYLDNGPQKIMLLGPADNDLAKSIAYYAAVPKYGLLQFSYGTDDLSLANDRNLYPYFFRTAISKATLDDLRIAFLTYFKDWKEVGIIYGDNLLDAQMSHHFKSRLQSKGIKVLAEVRLQENDPGRAITTIQEKDIHIIFGLFDVGLAARKLFCQAYKKGLYGPHYVWILQRADNNRWWVPNSGEDIGGCKDIEMTCQIQNYFNVKPTHGLFEKPSYFVYSNKTSSQLSEDYHSRVDNGSNTSNRSSNAWLVYDAVWSIAHVLKNSQGKLGKPLENITYGDLNISRVFYNETLKLNFESPNMQRVWYLSNGNRKFDMKIDQIVIKEENSNPSADNAGNYDFLSGKFIKKSINWLAGTPYRKTTNSYITRYIHRALFGALIFLACLGLLYALVCLIVVLVYRKQPVIWNSSPIMNTIIILGCILNYITIILYAFDWTTTTRTTSLCRARAWTFAIGFTLSVGGLVAKLWISYCVLSERFVRRWRNMLLWMLGMVIVLFIIDLIIMGCWEGIDPLQSKMVVYKEQEHYECFQPITDKTFQATWYTVEHCTCNHQLLWLLIVLIMKFIVVVFGVFLAWQTRKLYIKSLNDTQYCGFCLFVVFFFGIIGVLCALLTTKIPNLFFGLVGVIIFLCTTIILGLLYTNKIGRVTCKPKSHHGKTIFVGGAKESDTESSCCSCCACSPACCIVFCACFPCCNLYTCCRKCCFGAQVHPSKNDEKTEFYINGQPQDREGQIAYLLRELHERDAELARLRPINSYASMWTQTYEDDVSDNDDSSPEDDDEGNSLNSSNSSSALIGKRSKRKRNKVKIFNHGADYSHVRSKVDSGVAKSPQRKHDEKYYLGVWQAKGGRPTDAEISKLRAQLAEKDKEIEKLKKDRGNKSTKVTIISEDADNPKTQEKQCQTENNAIPRTNIINKSSSSTNTSPTRKTSKTRKTSTTAAKDKVVVITKSNIPEEKKDKKDEEKPVKNNEEWLFGKPKEIEEKTNSNDLSNARKTSKTDSKNTIIVINNDKKGHIEEERLEKSVNTQDEVEADKKSKNKEDTPKTIAISKQPDQHDDPKPIKTVTTDKENDSKNDNGIFKPKENEKKSEKMDNQKEEKHEEEEKGKQQQENETQKKADKHAKQKQDETRKREEEKEKEKEMRDKLEEEKKKEEEKEKQEKRKSRFSFFGGKRDSLPITKTADEPATKSDEHSNPVETKPESPNIENQDKPETLEKPASTDNKNKQEKSELPDLVNTNTEKNPENPVSLTNKEENSPKNPVSSTTHKQDKKEKSDQPTNEKQNNPENIQSPITNNENTPTPGTDKKHENKPLINRDENKKPDEPKKGENKPPNDVENKKPDESDNEDNIHILRPPQNTPASVDIPQDEEKKEKRKQSDQNPPNVAEKSEEYNSPNRDNDKDVKSDDELQEIDEDDDEEDDEEDDDDEEEGTNSNNDDDKENDDEDKNKRRKARRRAKKQIGGKLNWNAESKIDNSSGYTKRKPKKIKTYKVDYSHVQSKLSSSTKKNDSNDKTDTGNERKRTRVRRKRWNPNDKKT